MGYTLNYTGAEIDDILARAVQGGAIDQALATKQDALTFDAVPTEGSTNPAESGGIYDAIQAGGAAALAAFPTDSVSGDVVSFPDGADGIPVKAFTGSIVPAQNLNGQSAPYPAGGGKNKLPLPSAATANGVTLAVNTDGSIKLTGTATAAAAFDFISSGFDSSAYAGYIFSGGANWAGSSNGYSVRVMSGSTASQVITANETAIVDNGSGLRLTLRVGSGTAFPSGGLTLYPMLRASGTDNTFAPYANVCPISGWAEAELYRTGINLCNPATITDGYMVSNNGNLIVGATAAVTDYIPIKGNTSYYLRNTLGGSSFYSSAVYDANKTFIQNISVLGSGAQSGAITTPANARFIRVNMPLASKADFAVNYPSTDHDYHAYEGQTILLDFGQTVYAGTITALGGGKWQVQPTHALATINGTETVTTFEPSTDAGGGYLLWYLYTNVGMSDAKRGTAVNDPKLSNQFEWKSRVAPSQYKAVPIGQFSANAINSPDNWIVFCLPSECNTQAKAVAYVTANPIQVWYELADASKPDPIIVSADDLSTLLGANTVWTDVGAVTELEYRADTALYIQKLLNGGGTLQALSMASPSPSLSLGRVGVLAEPEEAEPEQTEEVGEQPEESEEE